MSKPIDHNRRYHPGSIAERWIYVTFIPTLLTVLVSCFAMRYITKQNYYSMAEQAIDFRIRSTISLLPSQSISKRDRYDGIVGLVEDFSEKDQFEFMLLGTDGNILVTSSGFELKDPSTVNEYQEAINSPDHTFVYTSDTDNNQEHILAITRVLVNDYGDASAIRIASSLSEIDKEINNMTKLYFGIGGIILLLVTLTGIFFIQSITSPLKKIGAVAGKIANGEFNTRIGDAYAGEIGDLVDSIDDMAAALESSNRLKNDFISSISHEIRTPLTSIKGWGETLHTIGNEDRELFNQGMEIIINETERLSFMVEDLLDFSRLEGNSELKYYFEDLDLNNELFDAVNTVQQRANKLGIKVNLLMPTEDIIIHADKNRVKQVLVNILDNAIKYSSASQQDINVSLSSESNIVSISIEDHGTGIPEEEIGKVTEKFYRASNSVYGTGIGLSISKEIMEAHNGALDIKSKIGKGTTVTLTFNRKHI